MKYIETKLYKRKRKLIKRSLRSQIQFDKQVAIRLSKPQYYLAMGQEVLNLAYKEKEKTKMSTYICPRLSSFFEKYKKNFLEKRNGIFFTLKGIYNSNVEKAQNDEEPPRHRDLLSLVANVPSLLVAYSTIKRNKGALTLGAQLAYNKIKWLNPTQRRFLSKTGNTPEGLNYQVFCTAAKLLKNGKYPWGASRRIYIPKPGQPGKLRPITIPPFMDRVVQAAILRVLEAIYEPWFEKLNRSFGFRPNKGCHDAIFNLTRQENRGLFMTIEGDIKGAYDNVKKEKLISILEKRINDKKFINLIKNRLDYIYFDSLKGTYVEDQRGIPQGGIDSPYLWNIYMHEFDLHVQEYMTQILSKANTLMRKGCNPETGLRLRESKSIQNKRAILKNIVGFLNKNIDKESFPLVVKQEMTGKGIRTLKELYRDNDNFYEKEGKYYIKKSIKYSFIKKVKLSDHRLRRQPSSDQTRLYLRHVYCRYADDWILLGNFNKIMAETIKKDLAAWLQENLHAELAMDKTAITDIRRKPAHFLGFEIRTRLTRKFSYVEKTIGSDKKTLSKVAGPEVTSWPDSQRLISRLHMKGYCNHLGQPRGLKWLTSLETFTIIERFNAVLRGFANYYNGFIHYPSAVNRWIYIIRYSAIFTIARKFNISARKVFKRFGLKNQYGKTISCVVRNNFVENGKNVVYYKRWTLLNYKELVNKASSEERFKKIKKIFYGIENDKEFPEYLYKKGSVPVVTNDDYLNKIIWVNLRTHASFDLPCSLCGSTQDIHMHHIKHIRKTPYYDLPENKTWLRRMSLRNRNQIPVCRDCHMNKIHRGTYDGANLRTLKPYIEMTKTGYDLRVINFENYLNPSEKEYFAKSLEEKGWKKEKKRNEKN